MEEQVLEMPSVDETALILVDLQNDFCHINGVAGKRGKDMEKVQAKFQNIKALVDSARENNIDIIHVITEHSSWTDAPSWKERWGKDENVYYCKPNTWGAEVFSLFEPKENEKIVIKHRYSGFVGTDLELILRTRGIKNVIVVGLFSNLCVDCTVRDAYMRDFFVTVPEDCVASDNDRLHEYAIEMFRYAFADVVNSTDLIDHWSNTRG